jgi:hypothetical protein
VKVKPVLSFATASSNDMIADRESRSKTVTMQPIPNSASLSLPGPSIAKFQVRLVLGVIECELQNLKGFIEDVSQTVLTAIFRLIAPSEGAHRGGEQSAVGVSRLKFCRGVCK